MMDGVPSDRRVTVVGGGIAGLVAAYECARIGVSVTLLEADARVGGCIRTEQIAGVDVDTGAESFATRGGTVRDLIDELGLADAVVAPSPEGAWLAFGDDAAPLPKAGLLGIPSNPLADDVRRIIGWSGAVRAYVDRIKPVLTIGTERNLGALVEKRMGRAVLENLVAPVTNGVYSADPAQLDVARAAPGLNNALTVAGSLSGAVATLRDNAPAGSAVGGFAGGMRVLVDALLATLANYEVRVLTSTRATRLEHLGDEQWRVHAETPSESEADSDAEAEALVLESEAVIVATPEGVATELLHDVVPEIAVPAAAEAPVVDIVTLAIDNAALDARPRGTGVLTAASAGRTAKALTHSSAKWPWLAAEIDVPHRHIVRVSFGRAGERSPLDGLDDEQIAELARSEATAMLGVNIAADDVVETLRTRWQSTLPRAFAGQKERASGVRDAVTDIPGLDITGAWLSGTGLASVIPDAASAAGRVRRRIISEVLDGE
ncbi:protoporphyrinogen oxidase [Paramicrobacterium agarici]|uniref:Coproporphyrinogen III oxidase n=1 Tax=Paramicrobacterium agarici TaxID=630514 RepID=A0A2A9DTL9_9MICO|nr:protoporphyrinogen oxidase [Microbacterium agarici]PFG29495.1 oxygen-dependent protoporphyrinogen oxidase [Microbacterium agarici]